MDNKRDKFNLTRQFALLSFVCILLISSVSALLLTQLFTDKILTQDANVSQEFINSITAADQSWRFFLKENPQSGDSDLDEFLTHISHVPDMVRANVYGRDGTMLWSSAPELIGEHFKDNDELEEALDGELVFESGIVGSTVKEEHKNLGDNVAGLRFVETYIPIWDGKHSTVVGAVELYKLPRALHQSIVEGQRLIWESALVGGLLLFAALYWIVKRASLVMESQHQQLIESRSLSMIGETASAVAHAMRNPLASIRACAELTLSDDLDGARESAMDIINESDRLDRWARELLQFSATNTQAMEQLELNELLRAVIAEHDAVLQRANISLDADLTPQRLPIEAHNAPLSQVFGNLIMNAIEAMVDHGKISIKTVFDPRDKNAIVTITDNGPGLSKEIKRLLFRPFATTKPAGTGLGLALSRRLVEHYEGSLQIDSPEGMGVTATIILPLTSHAK